MAEVTELGTARRAGQGRTRTPSSHCVAAPPGCPPPPCSQSPGPRPAPWLSAPAVQADPNPFGSFTAGLLWPHRPSSPLPAPSVQSVFVTAAKERKSPESSPTIRPRGTRGGPASSSSGHPAPPRRSVEPHCPSSAPFLARHQSLGHGGGGLALSLPPPTGAQCGSTRHTHAAVTTRVKGQKRG